MIVHSKTVAGIAAALFAVALILSMTTNAEADRVTFENGDRISGQIIHVIGGEIQIATDYAGTITASFDRVVDLRTDDAVEISLDDGSLIAGTIRSASAEHISIESQSLGSLNLPRAHLSELVREGATKPASAADKQSATAKQAPKAASPDEVWSGAFAVGLDLQRGNTDTSNVRLISSLQHTF